MTAIVCEFGVNPTIEIYPAIDPQDIEQCTEDFAASTNGKPMVAECDGVKAHFIFDESSKEYVFDFDRSTFRGDINRFIEVLKEFYSEWCGIPFYTDKEIRDKKHLERARIFFREKIEDMPIEITDIQRDSVLQLWVGVSYIAANGGGLSGKTYKDR